MSAQPTREEFLTMSFLAQQNFIPTAEEQRAPRFLALAPTTSASYPTAPMQKSPAPQSPSDTSSNPMADSTTAKAINTTSAAPSVAIIDEALKTRRSSSLSSDGSGQKKRFLKLGPVHFGEGGGKDDWSEAVDE